MSPARKRSVSLAAAAVGAWLGFGSLAVWLGGGYHWTWGVVVAGGAAAYVLLVAHVLPGTVNQGPAAEGPAVRRPRLLALAMGVSAGAVLIAGSGVARAPTILIAAAVAAALVVITFLHLAPPRTGTRPDVSSPGPLVLGIGGVVLSWYVTRELWPDSLILLWVLSPVTVFVLPGLALALALLRGVSLVERLLYAPSLSMGSLLAVVMWLDLLGLSNSFEMMSAASLAITVLGLLTAWRLPDRENRRAGSDRSASP